MHSRLSDATEIVGMSQSSRRPVDLSSVAPAVGRASAPSAHRSSRTIPRAATEPRGIDASLYLFALCKQLQMICLTRHGIDCLLDADGAGRLPEAACRMLGAMMCELVKDASACSPPETARRMVTVTLRRRGTTCLCTISWQGRMDLHEDAQPLAGQSIPALAERRHDVLMIDWEFERLSIRTITCFIGTSLLVQGDLKVVRSPRSKTQGRGGVL